MSKKIWIVDDVLSSAGKVGMDLKKIAEEIGGMELEFFKTAESAVELLDSGSEKPDLILMDSEFCSSRLQGDEAAAGIRFFYPEIFLINISGDSSAAMKADGKILKSCLTRDFEDEDGLIRKLLKMKK